MPRVSRTIDVAVAPAELYAVIVDFPRYPEFLGNVRSATPLLTAGTDDWTVVFGIEVIRHLHYTLRLWRLPERDDGAIVVRWSLVEGQAFRANEGSWTLVPTPAGEDGRVGTRATYELAIDLAMFLPTSLATTLAGTSLGEMLEAFRARAEGSSRPVP